MKPVNVLFILAAVGLTACEKAEAPQTTQAQRDTPAYTEKDAGFQVIFKHNGCEFGRYTDPDTGRYVHTITCGNGSAGTSEEVSCGEDCKREEVVVTTPPPNLPGFKNAPVPTGQTPR